MKRVLTLAGGSTNQFVHRFNDVIGESLLLPVETVDETKFTRLFFSLSYNIEAIFIHWPDSIFWGSKNKLVILIKGVLILLFLTIQAILGAKIIWVVNNLIPHDVNKFHDKFCSIYFNLLGRFVHGWLTLSPSTHELVMQKYPVLESKPNSFVWHPPYKSIQNAKKTSNENVVFGYAGHLKESKNFLSAIVAFQHLSLQKTELLLSGAINAKYENILLRQIQGQKNIKLSSGFISDNEYETLMSNIDIVIVPYNHYLHSGVIVHALSYNKIIVCKKTNFSMDLAVHAPDNFILYDRDISKDILSEAVEKFGQFPQDVLCIDFLSETANVDRLKYLVKKLKL